MLVPLTWLKEYTDMDIEVAEFCDRMIMGGIGVESVSTQGEAISGVVTGRILELEKHPDADKLSVCKVDVGAETPLQIITGADNVFEGAIIPVATHGARLAGGLKIKRSKMRGVPSEGMLCSEIELGIGEDASGIMILSEDTEIGHELGEVMELSSVAIDFEVYANRPDRQSIIGIARETAAVLEQELRLPEIKIEKTISDPMTVSVEVEDGDLCPRYMARLIKNVRIAPSPKWMQDRLEAAGVRAINNIVDATNYVMLELGQPMHAFDLACVRDNKIIVRRAKAGEKLTTLDEKERELTEDMLLITDPQGPIGIAGVMGGANSEITETTRDIVLESAKFDGPSIRQTAKALGMMTESSQRFVKGVDVVGVADALDRCAQLIVMMDGGDCVDAVVDVCAASYEPIELTVSPYRINKLLGLQLQASDMIALLNRAFVPARVAGAEIGCSVPSFRQDIRLECDIAEEIARMFGYDNIPTRLSGDMQLGLLPQREMLENRMKAQLTALGYYEAYTYSFTGPREMEALGLDANAAIKLLNPFGEDQSLMRIALLPSLLKVVSANFARKRGSLRFFETAAVYLPHGLPLSKPPEEEQRLAIVLSDFGADFYELKGTIESLLQALNVRSAKYSAGGPEHMQDGQCAILTIGGAVAGYLGKVLPTTLVGFEIERDVFAAELNIGVILNAVTDSIELAPPARFPGVDRDIALVMDEFQEAGPIADMMVRVGKGLVECARPFDVYRGAQVPDGKKSVAFALTLRAKDKTLTDKDSQAIVDRILARAAEEFGAQLR